MGKVDGPAPADIFYNCGAALWNRGRAPEAIEMLDAALRARPDYPEALCLGGFILGEAGQTDAALRFYDQALELQTRFSRRFVQFRKAAVQPSAVSTKRLPLSIRRSPSRPPTPTVGTTRAGALRELGRWEESLAACQQAMHLRPDFAEATLNYGTALMKLDRHEEALPIYAQAKALKPDFAAAMCGEGLTLKALGRFDEALAAFDEAVRLGNVDAISNRGCLLLMRGAIRTGLGRLRKSMAGRQIAEGRSWRQIPGHGRARSSPANGFSS